MMKFEHHKIQTSALLGAFASALLLLYTADVDASGRGLSFGPEPVTWFVVDRSGSMDFAHAIGEVPAWADGPELCSDEIEYARTRHVLMTESLNGTLLDYCPYEMDRPASLDGRDTSDLVVWPHTAITDSERQDNGLLLLWSPFVNLGFGTFDAMESPDEGRDGDYSLGVAYNAINLGLANEHDPTGGLVRPLPSSGFPTTDGSQSSWRQYRGNLISDRIDNMVPGLGSPMAAALEDIEWLRHADAGVLNDPYESCRPHTVVAIWDGMDSYANCHGDEGDIDGLNNRCDFYTLPSTADTAARLIDSSDCSSCEGSGSIRPVPTYVITFNTDDPNLAHETAIAGGTCAVLNSDGSSCLQGAFIASDHAGTVASLGTVMNQIIGEVRPAIIPQTMRTADDGTPGFARFTAGTDISWDSPFWQGWLNREAFYCDVDSSGNGYLAQGETIQFAEQFDRSLALDADRQIFTNRLDRRSCTLSQCNSCDEQPDCALCGSEPGSVPDPLSDSLSGFGDGTGGIQMGGTLPGAIPPLQENSIASLFGFDVESGLSFSDLPTSVEGFTWICLDEQSVMVNERDLDNHIEGGATYGHCTTETVPPGFQMVCHNGITYIVNNNLARIYLSGDDTLGACNDDTLGEWFCLPDGRSLFVQTQDAEMAAIANGATPGKCFSSDVESGLWEVCQIRNNDPSSARTVLLNADEVPRLLDTGGYLGACIESDDLSGDADSRSAINTALTEDRDSGFWLENAVPDSTTPMNFDAADSDGDCMVPLDLATWEDHPEYFSASSAQEVESIIRFAHGWTLSDIAGDGLLSPHFDPDTVASYDRDSTNYLGDFFHTTLAVEVPPSHLVRSSQGYTEFVNEYWDRRAVVFAGSNDGQVYCFDAETGDLLWSYVPGSFLPQLGLTMYSRRPMIDGPLVLADLICGQTDEGLPEYCTVLSINYGAGGSGMTLLDVTDPEKPRFVMEITGRDVPELGLSTATPLLTNAYIENGIGDTAQVQGIVVLPGGYPAGGIETLIDGNLIGYSAGEVLLVTDLEGAILRQFDPVNEPQIFRACGAVTGSPAGWSPEITRTVYVTTQYGCLLRLDMSSAAPMEWSLSIHDKSTNPGMGILKPAIATNSDGTLTIVYTQGSAEFEPNLNRITSLVSVQENLTLSDASFGNPSVYSIDAVDLNEREHVNYELVFQPGESVTAAPFIANGTVYFATWAPNSSEACDQGNARLWGIDYVGNTNIEGPEGDRPYLVDSSSERLIPMWPNPDPSISDNPVVPYLTADQLRDSDDGWSDSTDYSIIYGLSIETVPTCELIDIISEAGGTSESRISGETVRQLQVSMAQGDSGLAEDAFRSNEEVENISISLDMPDFDTSGYPLSWGPELIF